MLCEDKHPVPARLEFFSKKEKQRATGRLQNYFYYKNIIFLGGSHRDTVYLKKMYIKTCTKICKLLDREYKNQIVWNGEEFGTSV